MKHHTRLERLLLVSLFFLSFLSFLILNGLGSHLLTIQKKHRKLHIHFRHLTEFLERGFATLHGLHLYKVKALKKTPSTYGLIHPAVWLRPRALKFVQWKTSNALDQAASTTFTTCSILPQGELRSSALLRTEQW